VGKLRKYYEIVSKLSIKYLKGRFLITSIIAIFANYLSIWQNDF